MPICLATGGADDTRTGIFTLWRIWGYQALPSLPCRTGSRNRRASKGADRDFSGARREQAIPEERAGLRRTSDDRLALGRGAGERLFDRIVSRPMTRRSPRWRSVGRRGPLPPAGRLSDDFTPTRSVINHAVGEVERLSGGRVETVCCLYATAAFVTAPDLVAARRMLDDSPGRRFVFAAARYPHPIQRAMRLRREGGVEMFFPEAAGARSQDLPEAFHDAGQFYWGRRDSFLENHPMFAAHSHPFVLPEGRTRDIDAPEDWEFAEQLFMLARGCGRGP